MKDAAFWIEKLDLQPHPEGGYFIQTYRSNEVIPKEALPTRFEGDHVFSTSIYFLLDKKDYSAFHIMEQDEIWHFYDGSSLTIHIIDQNGNYSAAKLGRDIENNECFQIIVKGHSYFAASVNNIDSYTLVGCTVAPGFEYADWKMPTREKLIDDFPQHIEIIEKFTHESQIYHITTQEAWDVAKSNGELHEATLDQEGFIHCSYPNQIVQIANDLYKGQKNLLIIGIKRSQTNCRVVDEAPYNLNELFPHVYGPIPVSSVFEVYPFACDDKGYFSLPTGITEIAVH